MCKKQHKRGKVTKRISIDLLQGFIKATFSVQKGKKRGEKE